MASYGVDRELYPFTFEYSDCDGDCTNNAGYATFANILDDDTLTFGQSEDTDKPSNAALFTMTGFSDGIAFSGPVGIVIDHEVVGNALGAIAWQLKLEASINDGSAWRTLLDYTAGGPGENRAKLKETYSVYDMTAQGQLNLRVTFTQNTSSQFARHKVFQVYAKKIILGGGMF